MLLSEWISHSVQPVAWVSLDEGDNDPRIFWLNIIASIQNTYTDLGELSLSLLQSLQPLPVNSFITTLLNGISDAKVELTIILDDFHVIADTSIYNALSFLIEHMPPELHLIIATRADPPISLARLRGLGQLDEFRADDLRFTRDEINEYFNGKIGLNLHPEAIVALESHTEGWIVGVQLTALSLQGRSDIDEFIRTFTGSHRYILEYLTEEILQRQPEMVRRFLLQTCILKYFCASLCDCVTGNDNSDTMLELIRRGNLFIIPLDDEGYWYRYHNLFEDLLVNYLKKEMSTKEIHVLHSRASEWYEKNGLIIQAVNHAIIIQDFERAAALIEGAVTTSMLDGRTTILLKWLQEIPRELISKRPRLSFFQAYAIFLHGDINLAEQMLHTSRQILEKSPLSSENKILLGELAALLSPIASMQYDSTTTIKEARMALKYLPESDMISRARVTMALGLAYGFDGKTTESIKEYKKANDLALAAGNHFLAASILGALALALVYQGRLHQAANYYRQIIDLDPGQEISRFPPASIGYIGLAEICLEWNKLEAAEENLTKGLQLCQSGDIGYYLFTGYCIQARLKFALGDVEGSRNLLVRVEELFNSEHPSHLAFHIGWYQVRLWSLLDDLDKAEYWAQTIPDMIKERMPGGKLPPALDEIQQILRAKIFLEQGKNKQVLEIFDAVCTKAETAGRIARVVEISLLKALALNFQGKTTEAFILLERSLSLTRSGGYIRLFLDEGAPMQELLSAYFQDINNPARIRQYAKTIIEAFDKEKRTAVTELSYPLSKFETNVSFELLTRRELEILILIADGLSNQDIATKLCLATGTIKKHINNIYGKMQVSKRTQAVARARDLGLL
jgi:LuxR family maltose regulon positive regulatory protein